MASVSAEDATREFLGGAGFPVFAVTLLALVGAGMVAILVVPSGEGGLGAFADEFRRWCFGWDPATGRYDLALSFVMLSPPWMLAAMIAALWWQPLRQAFARPARLARPAGAAALVVAAIAGSFAWLAPAAPAGEIAFPARELRTAHPAPSLQLTNQAGEPVDLAALRGKVVMLSALLNPAGFGESATVSVAAWVLLALLVASGLLATIAMSRAGVRYFWATHDRPVPRLRIIETLPIGALLLLVGALVWQADAVLRYVNATARGLHDPKEYIGTVMSAKPVPSPNASGEGGLRR